MKNIIILFAFMILSCILAGCGDNSATGDSATIVFITDISNGYGRINPAMSTNFIVGAEDGKLNDMIEKYYDANNRLRYKEKTQEIDYMEDKKPVVDLLVKIQRYIAANPRVLNRRYIGNRLVLTGVSVGSTLYCWPNAQWNNGQNLMCWVKKIVVKPGENQIIFANDYSAIQL